VVAADEAGVEVGSITAAATSEGHLKLVKWAASWEQRKLANVVYRTLLNNTQQPALTNPA